MIYPRILRSLLILMLATSGLFAQNGGTALGFDGVDDFLLTKAGSGSGLDFSGASNLTVSLWIYPNDPLSPASQQLFHKEHSGGLTVQYNLYLVGGVLCARIDRFTIGNHFLIGPSPVITQSKWYYVSLVKSGSSFSIFVDGVLYATSTIPAAQLAASTSTSDIYFGRHGDFPGIVAAPEFLAFRHDRQLRNFNHPPGQLLQIGSFIHTHSNLSFHSTTFILLHYGT